MCVITDSMITCINIQCYVVSLIIPQSRWSILAICLVFLILYVKKDSICLACPYDRLLLMCCSLKIVQQLYSLGARKVMVTAVGQIGCIPYQLARFHGNSSRCNEKINNAISLFNSGLKTMVQNFNGGQLPGAKFVYLDFYQSSQDLSSNGTSYGNSLWLRHAF